MSSLIITFSLNIKQIKSAINTKRCVCIYIYIYEIAIFIHILQFVFNPVTPYLIKIMDQFLLHLIQEVTSHKSLKKHAAKKGKCQYLFHVFCCLIKIVRLNISTLLCDEMIVNNGLRRIKK